MRKYLAFIGICAVFGAEIFGEDLATPKQFEPLKDFAPAKPITPQNSQSYGLDNQFDRAVRDYYFVGTKNQSSPDLWHLNSLFYGRNFYNSALFRYREANYYTIFNATHSKANGYEDGGGNDVNFGYERLTQSFILGYLPNEMNENRLVFIHDRITDDTQPEHTMDAKDTNRYILKFNSRLGQSDDSNTANIDFSYIKLDRKANNYDLRQNTGQKILMQIDRDIWELGLRYDADFGVWHNSVGVSYEHDFHRGTRNASQNNQAFRINAYRFGDVVAHNYKIFDTIYYNFNENNKLSLGLNYIYNDVTLKKNSINLGGSGTAMAAIMKNPQELYLQYYGINFGGSVDSDAFSAALRYDYKGEFGEGFGEIGTVSRIATNNERFASVSGQNGGGQVGNPHLKPEKHNFIKLGYNAKNSAFKDYLNSLTATGFSVGGSVMADDIDDLIIYDRARGQYGIVTSDGSVISRNIDGKIFTAKGYAMLNFCQNFGAKINLAYAYGENDTDDRPLYQIAPFEAIFNLDYKDYASFGSYNAGLGVRYVAGQSRGDFDKNSGLGIDSRETNDAFSTLDLYFGLNFRDKFSLNFGVNNLFDRRYAEFISPNRVEAFAPTLVNAPGRVFYLNFSADF